MSALPVNSELPVFLGTDADLEILRNELINALNPEALLGTGDLGNYKGFYLSKPFLEKLLAQMDEYKGCDALRVDFGAEFITDPTPQNAVVVVISTVKTTRLENEDIQYEKEGPSYTNSLNYRSGLPTHPTQPET